jgi:hypothetical protein
LSCGTDSTFANRKFMQAVLLIQKQNGLALRP